MIFMAYGLLNSLLMHYQITINVLDMHCKRTVWLSKTQAFQLLFRLRSLNFCIDAQERVRLT